MSDETKRDPLDRVEELFEFLQGKVPKGFQIPADEVPLLSADQAWTVIWYLGNLYWQIPDHIERCDECGVLYDCNREGSYSENGPPYHSCDDCDHLRPPEDEDEADG